MHLPISFLRFALYLSEMAKGLRVPRGDSEETKKKENSEEEGEAEITCGGPENCSSW